MATVQILVEARDEVDASDKIHSFLAGSTVNGILLDWGYLQVGKQFLHPVEWDGIDQPFEY